MQLGSVKVESGIIVGKMNAYECIKHINKKKTHPNLALFKHGGSRTVDRDFFN